MIRDGARRAIAGVAPGEGTYVPYRVESPTTLRVGWNSTTTAALCENLPGMKRVAPREIEYTSTNYPEMYRLLRVLLTVGAGCAATDYTYD